MIDDNFGYHKREIVKGLLGEPSKIEEEFHEFMDAIDQDNPLMALHELSDMIGAIQFYLNIHHNSITLEDLITMSNATKRAFNSGQRD